MEKGGRRKGEGERGMEKGGRRKGDGERGKEKGGRKGGREGKKLVDIWGNEGFSLKSKHKQLDEQLLYTPH